MFEKQVESGLAALGCDIHVGIGPGWMLTVFDRDGTPLPVEIRFDGHDACVSATLPGAPACRVRARGDVLGVAEDIERVVRALRPDAPGLAARG